MAYNIEMYKISFCILIIAFAIKLSECGIRVIADDRFQEECLVAHNKYRDLHDSYRLKTNRSAIEYSIHRIRGLAKIDGPIYNQHNKALYGENFYWYYDNNGYKSCEEAIDLWYKGIHQYNFNRPGFSDKSGGFSQLIWRSSKYVGCARVEDDTRSYFETYVVCNYWPAGNVDGQYPFNVYPPRDTHPSVDRPSNSGGISSGSVGGSGWGGDRPEILPERPIRPSVPAARPKPPTRPQYPLSIN